MSRGRVHAQVADLLDPTVATLLGGAIVGSLLGAGAASATANPYNSDGTWLVPTEIAPGTYRAVSNDGTGTGYYAVCGDYSCEPGAGNSMISNDFFSGSSIIVVPPNAVSVELDGVALTRLS